MPGGLDRGRMADDGAPGDAPMPDAGAGDGPPAAAAAAKAKAAPEPGPGPGPEATAAAGAAEAAEGTEEMVEPEVPPVALGSLQDMGFSRNKAVRALHGSGGGVDQAIAWLEEHEGDADLETPLLVPKSSIKPKLTPEEAKAAAEEMVRKAKKRREAEEAKLEKQREKMRVEMGKHIQAAQRLEEQEVRPPAAGARSLYLPSVPPQRRDAGTDAPDAPDRPCGKTWNLGSARRPRTPRRGRRSGSSLRRIVRSAAGSWGCRKRRRRRKRRRGSSGSGPGPRRKKPSRKT